MKNIIIWIIIVVIASGAVCGGLGCASVQSSHDIPVVKNFEPARYLGTWYEIARLPQWYERGIVRASATYTMDGDTLRITNRGFRDDGTEKISTAVGHLAGPPSEGAFRISFFRPFYGDYRIIWLSSNYDLALVTGNDRSSLWILARTATIPVETRDALVAQAAHWGFDVTKLEYPQ